jgi:hypothetical protein
VALISNDFHIVLRYSPFFVNEKLAIETLSMNSRVCLPTALGRRVNMLNKLACVLLLFLVFGASQARADSEYEIIGTLTIPGNSANPGVGETINFSVELDYAGSSPTATLVGTPVITSFGPLGTFGIAYVPGSAYEIGFGSPDAVIELDSSFFTIREIPYTFYSDVWGCFDPVICAEFYPISSFNGPTVGNALLWPGTATAAVYQVSTPEPGTLGFCVLGLLTMFLLKKRIRALG